VYEVLERFLRKRGSVSVHLFNNLERQMMHRYGATKRVFGDDAFGCVWLGAHGILRTFAHYELPANAIDAALSVREQLTGMKKPIPDELLISRELKAMLAAKGISTLAKANRYRRRHEAAANNA
jgi:hypothetical protein